MSEIKNGILQVPEASIYYEVRGKGPVFFLFMGKR